MDSVAEILENLGYKLKKHPNYFQTSALYRSGDNPSSVVIYPHDNLVIDYALGEKFSIEALIGKTLKLEDYNKIEDWLKEKKRRSSGRQLR